MHPSARERWVTVVRCDGSCRGWPRWPRPWRSWAPEASRVSAARRRPCAPTTTTSRRVATPRRAGLLARNYIGLAGHALLRSGRDSADAKATIAHPTPANCARVIVDVIRIQKVVISEASGVRIGGGQRVGEVVKFNLSRVPGASGERTQLSVVLTDENGHWVITGFG